MLSVLRRIVQDVLSASSVSFSHALELLVHDVRVALGTEVCSIYLLNPETNEYLFVANEGLNKEFVGKLGLSRKQGLVALVAVSQIVFGSRSADGYGSQLLGSRFKKTLCREKVDHQNGSHHDHCHQAQFVKKADFG